MKGLFVLMTVCTLTAAMVPLERRALTNEEESPAASATTSAQPPVLPICAPQTPCAWSTYKGNPDILDVHIDNSFCKCSEDTTCQVNEDDKTVSALIHRCRPLGEDEES